MKKLFYIALSLLAVSVTACKDDGLTEVDLGYLELISSDVRFDYHGGSGEIVANTTSNVTATIAADGTWVTIATKGNVVTVTVPAYSELDSRNSYVTVSAGGRSVVVPVSQTSFALVPSLSTLDFTAAAGSKSASFTPGDVTVTASSNKSWAKVAVNNDTDMVTITVEATGDIVGRTATITLQSDKEEATIVVSQAAGASLSAIDLSKLTWKTWANGVFVGAWDGEEVEKTISKADGLSIFRIDSPYVEGYHYSFAWNTGDQAVGITPIGIYTFTVNGVSAPTLNTGIISGNGPVYWCTDPDPEYTAYDPEEQAFIINSAYSVVVDDAWLGGYGWFDDYFFIDEFLQGNPWE